MCGCVGISQLYLILLALPLLALKRPLFSNHKVIDPLHVFFKDAPRDPALDSHKFRSTAFMVYQVNKRKILAIDEKYRAMEEEAAAMERQRYQQQYDGSQYGYWPPKDTQVYYSSEAGTGHGYDYDGYQTGHVPHQHGIVYT